MLVVNSQKIADVVEKMYEILDSMNPESAPNYSYDLTMLEQEQFQGLYAWNVRKHHSTIIRLDHVKPGFHEFMLGRALSAMLYYNSHGTEFKQYLIYPTKGYIVQFTDTYVFAESAFIQLGYPKDRAFITRFMQYATNF